MVQAAFEKLLTQIGLSQSQRSEGSVSHQHVRSLLDNKHERDPLFPWLAEGDFLSGSYARGTKIHPLNDIDVMMVIDGTGLHAIEGGQILDIEVRGQGEMGSPVGDYKGPDGLISSKLLLEAFRDALKESYPNSDIRKNGQAVNVWLDSKGLGLDIVPCFHLIPRNGNLDFYYIPQGGESHEWIKTNPKKDHEICEYLDAKHDKKFKSAVRLLKHWNRVYNADRLESYHLEAIAYHVFHYHPDKVQDHASALRYFFAQAPAWLRGTCPDPTGIGDPIGTRLTPENKRLSIARMEEALAITNQRSLSMPILPAPALVGWRKIFGQSFGT